MLTKIKFFFEVTLFSNVCFCFSTFHKTNQNLVDSLIKQGVIKSDEVASVMRSVDRGDFVSSSMSYVDSPQPIGFHATISAPHMHAFALVVYYFFKAISFLGILERSSKNWKKSLRRRFRKWVFDCMHCKNDEYSRICSLWDRTYS